MEDKLNTHTVKGRRCKSPEYENWPVLENNSHLQSCKKYNFFADIDITEYTSLCMLGYITMLNFQKITMFVMNYIKLGLQCMLPLQEHQFSSTFD